MNIATARSVRELSPLLRSVPVYLILEPDQYHFRFFFVGFYVRTEPYAIRRSVMRASRLEEISRSRSTLKFLSFRVFELDVMRNTYCLTAGVCILSDSLVAWRFWKKTRLAAMGGRVHRSYRSSLGLDCCFDFSPPLIPRCVYCSSVYPVRIVYMCIYVHECTVYMMSAMVA